MSSKLLHGLLTRTSLPSLKNIIDSVIETFYGNLSIVAASSVVPIEPETLIPRLPFYRRIVSYCSFLVFAISDSSPFVTYPKLSDAVRRFQARLTPLPRRNSYPEDLSRLCKS
jgi:hypothetical protein